MKPETNKEMELMLRRLARRSSGRVPDNNGNVISEPHLDADEMSAYAEQALPAAARARYTEHLADCSRCREIVVGLSASLGRPVVAKASTPEERGSIKNFFATLLSPMFARYAIPTLALVGIIGIAVIVFRQQPPGTNLAQKPDQTKQIAQANGSPTPPPSTLTDNATDGEPAPTAKDNSGPTGKTVAANKEIIVAKPGDQAGAVAPAEAPPPPILTPKAEGDTSRREADTDQKRPVIAERQEQSVDEAKGRDRENAKKEDRADDKAMTESQPAKTTVARAADVNKNEVAKSKSGQATVTTGAGQFAVEAEEKRKGAREVRAVAGRRFERAGNAWVDTAYQSGRATTNLSRGSEQYRALIADEPEIRTIAETLSGEVVVIWKGRAYKIR